MTAVPTMKTFASDVSLCFACSPSIGTGKASTNAAAAESAKSPAAVEALGLEMTSSTRPIVASAEPANVTGRTTGRSHAVSREIRTRLAASITLGPRPAARGLGERLDRLHGAPPSRRGPHPTIVVCSKYRSRSGPCGIPRSGVGIRRRLRPAPAPERALGQGGEKKDGGHGDASEVLHGGSFSDGVLPHLPRPLVVPGQHPPGGHAHPKRVNRCRPYDRTVERTLKTSPRLVDTVVARTPAPLLVVAAAFSFQSGAALATTLFEEAGPLGAVWLRQFFGAVVLVALNAGVVRRCRSRSIRPVLALGATLALMNSLFYASIDRIPLGVAVTAEFLGPLAVAVAGSRRPRDFVWTVLAGAGVALLGSPTTDVDPVGLALALSAGACWGGYILIGKRLGEEWPLLDGLTLAMAIAAALMTPVGLVAGGSALVGPPVLAVGLAVGILGSVVPYALELTALRRLTTAAFGILMSLEPAIAALVGALILSQALSPLEGLAVAFVVVASIGANLHTRAPIPPSWPD